MACQWVILGQNSEKFRKVSSTDNNIFEVCPSYLYFVIIDFGQPFMAGFLIFKHLCKQIPVESQQ